MLNGNVNISDLYVQKVKGHIGEIAYCRWAPHGDTFLTATINGPIIVWNVGTHYIGYYELDYNYLSKNFSPISAVDWDSDGRIAAIAHEDGTIELYEKNGLRLRTLTGHTSKIEDAKFNANGLLISGCSQKGKIIVWNSLSGRISRTLLFKSEATILNVEWNSDTSFAAGAADGSLGYFNVDMPEPEHWFDGHDKEINEVKWNPQKNILASSSDDGTIKLWNINKTHYIQEFKINDSEAVFNIEWSPIKQQLVSWCSDSTIQLWDVESGVCNNILLSNRTAIATFSISPDGTLLACATSMKYLQIFCLSSGQLMRKYLCGHKIMEVEWSPSGTMILVTTLSGEIYLFDVRMICDT